MSTQPPPTKPTLHSAEGIALPKSAEFVDTLDSQFGSEYTLTFVRAIDADNRDDQPRRETELAAAIDILVRAGWTHEQSRTIVRSHVKFVYAAAGQDLQAHVDNGGTLSTPRRSSGGETA
ncbi:hypothetical protein OG225_26385 [Nocardia sp. NBC_01377]|uniref:hypothetical protein n=1 Tax=Nocardia sp. NBC_01377 TaxID=2903595 RepID=UPI003256405B